MKLIKVVIAISLSMFLIGTTPAYAQTRDHRKANNKNVDVINSIVVVPAVGKQPRKTNYLKDKRQKPIIDKGIALEDRTPVKRVLITS